MLNFQPTWTTELSHTFEIFTPPPNQTATEWADEHYYISRPAALPGPFQSKRTPFIRGILDEFTNPDCETISVRAPRQVVKTTVILIGIGMSIHVDPCSMLWLEPTLDLAESVSKRRLSPMIDDVSVLAERFGPAHSRDANQTILNKVFPGGTLTIAGANSTTGLISEPRKKIFYDEIDYYPATIGQHGDPIATSLECAVTFWDRKIIYVSRPSVKGLSRIDACIADSDDRYFYVPCHDCGQGQRLEWEQVKWTDNNPATAVYVCKFCSAPWDDAQRKENMLMAEEKGFGWRGERAFNGHAGFSLNGIYHIWRPLSRFVKNFIHANTQKKQGNLQPLRDWENDEFGQSWEEEGEKVAAQPLLERRENYGAERLPWKILWLTAGIDVQDDRLEIEIVGWRAINRQDNPESWGVEDMALYFNKAEANEDLSKTTWNELDALLQKTYTTQDGRELRISAACIDSGGHKTAEVYKFCDRRLSRHIYAIKGIDGPRPIWTRRASKSKKYKGSLVWLVGVDTAKDVIYGSLRVQTEGPGFAHFPAAYGPDFFRELTSEQVRTKYRNGRPYRCWELPSGVPNHALDRRAYALAALYSRSVPWEILAKSAPSEPPPDKPPDDTPPTSSGPITAPAKLAAPQQRPQVRPVRYRFGFGRR